MHTFSSKAANKRAYPRQFYLFLPTLDLGPLQDAANIGGSNVNVKPRTVERITV
ncbi:hypothetical protein FRC15_011438 [Serendipita sp. 397]|nr:hypothetical protein FRC15_011438 [Serendipita sp. 397]